MSVANSRFVVLFSDGSTDPLDAEFSFDDALGCIIDPNTYQGMQTSPVGILMTKAGIFVYADKAVISSYLNDEIDRDELTEKLWCHGLYRNCWFEFGDSRFEAGALWMRRNDTMRLVDDDSFFEAPYSDAIFTKL